MKVVIAWTLLLPLLLPVRSRTALGDDSAPPTADGASEFHDLPAILATHPPAAKPAVSTSEVLQLKTFDGDPELRRTNEHGAIFRELVRQALLLTAREELGLATRDQTLREPFLEVSPQTVDGDRTAVTSIGAIHIASSILGQLDDAEELRMTIFREGENGPESLWEHRIEIPDPRWHSVETLCGRLEKLTREDLRAELMRLGFKGSRNGWDESGEVPESVLEMASRWNPLSQYYAIRALHRSIRTDGESPRRLAELSRAYARLGVMTQHHWSAAHEAFKARAILYSQRLAVRDRGSVEARQARAYVLALVGRQQLAIDVQLTRLKEAEGGWTPEMEVIDAFCHFDPNRLDALATQAELKPLVRILQFLTEEHVPGPVWFQPVMRRTMETLPAWFGPLDVLARRGSMGVNAAAADDWPRRLAATVWGRMDEARSFPDAGEMPPATVKILQQGPDNAQQRRPADPAGSVSGLGGDESELTRRRELVESLDRAAASDRDEPAWGVLGQLIAEENFRQADTTVRHYRRQWDESDEAYIALVETLYQFVAGHPYADAIRLSRRTPIVKADEVHEFLDSLRPAELTLAIEPLANDLHRIVPEAWQRMVFPAIEHLSPVYRDLVLRMVKGRAWGAEANSLQLERIARRSPMQAYGNLRYRSHVSRIANSTQRYEDAFGYHPRVLEQLAIRYEQTGKWEAAERVRVRWVEIEASLDAYRGLARHYGSLGNEDRWLEVMEAFLVETEPLGLSHVTARNQIARFWMGRGDFERALPYAEKAAQSYAMQPMVTANHCREVLGDYERAEQWIREASKNYLGYSTRWYFWCHRTGRGDVQAAESYAESRIDRLIERGARSDRDTIAQFRYAIGVPEIAAGIFEEQYREHDSLIHALLAGIIWDELRDLDRRDAMFREILEHGPGDDAESRTAFEFTRQLTAALHVDERLADVDTRAIDRVIADAPRKDATAYNAYIGRLLWDRGHRERAERYLRMAATSFVNSPSRDIAGALLREHGIDPGPPRADEPRPEVSPTP